MKKRISIIVVVLLIVIIAVMAFNYKTVGWVWDNITAPVFDFNENSEDIWDGGTSVTGLQYSSVSETDYLNLYIPSNIDNAPLFVLVHGGGFVTNDNMSRQARLMINYYRDNGYAVASVNYRLAQEALYPAAIEDVKAAVRFLRSHADEYGYNADNIAIWGESAGGYLAAMAAFTDDSEFNDLEYIDQDIYGDVSARVDTLVDFYGIIDMSTHEADWEELGLPMLIYNIANNWAMGYMKEVGASSIEEAWIGKAVSEMTADEFNQINPMYY
ncbi:MAG: alpha/beta hydrolase, partial [Butyrivibrio sp.]|nr:alpha/beta hydrolase [Butyrivibrio sp.]